MPVPFALTLINCLMATALIIPSIVAAESGCLEYKIVDHGDSVEAVCIGKPATSFEKKELEKQNIQERKSAQENEIRQLEMEMNNRLTKKERLNAQQIEQKTNLKLRKSEIELKREEVLLEREKERLRREQLNNDKLEDDLDDISKKLDKASGIDKKSKKKKNIGHKRWQ